jgi:hypothetical protein
MLMLFRAAQVYHAVIGILDVQADGGLVEFATELQVGHVEHGMARSDDVEGRLEDVLRYGHCVSLGLVIPGRSVRTEPGISWFPDAQLRICG